MNTLLSDYVRAMYAHSTTKFRVSRKGRINVSGADRISPYTVYLTARMMRCTIEVIFIHPIDILYSSNCVLSADLWDQLDCRLSTIILEGRLLYYLDVLYPLFYFFIWECPRSKEHILLCTDSTTSLIVPFPTMLARKKSRMMWQFYFGFSTSFFSEIIVSSYFITYFLDRELYLS